LTGLTVGSTGLRSAKSSSLVIVRLVVVAVIATAAGAAVVVLALAIALLAPALGFAAPQAVAGLFGLRIIERGDQHSTQWQRRHQAQRATSGAA
jgi:hypothetical protein